jgi:molybdopterin converting factor small subunit
MANWQTFGAVWGKGDGQAVVVVDADWGNDKSEVTCAIILPAQTTVGKLREHLRLPEGEGAYGGGVEYAKQLAYPVMQESVASLAQADGQTMEELGIMVGVEIKRVAESMDTVSRDIDEIAQFVKKA